VRRGHTVGQRMLLQECGGSKSSPIFIGVLQRRTQPRFRLL
jgi:hypothetical protein